MSEFITILIIIVGILLGLVVLIQNPKGGGLASGFTGANQFGGVKRTNDFLDKTTWTLVIALFVLSVFSSSLTNQTTVVTDEGATELENMIQDEPGATPQAPAPLEDAPVQE